LGQRQNPTSSSADNFREAIAVEIIEPMRPYVCSNMLADETRCNRHH
jgi:hypothetical protein